MKQVRTTFQPDLVLEVDDVEARSLARQGLLVDQEYTGPMPEARVAAANPKKEGQE